MRTRSNEFARARHAFSRVETAKRGEKAAGNEQAAASNGSRVAPCAASLSERFVRYGGFQGPSHRLANVGRSGGGSAIGGGEGVPGFGSDCGRRASSYAKGPLTKADWRAPRLAGRTPLVEAVPGVYPRGRSLRQALCRRNGAPILDRGRLKTELCRQFSQLRQVPLSPSPGDQIAFLPPFGILGRVRTGTHGRGLPISGAASRTGMGRVRTAATRRPLPAATGASVLAVFPRSAFGPFVAHHRSPPSGLQKPNSHAANVLFPLPGTAARPLNRDPPFRGLLIHAPSQRSGAALALDFAWYNFCHVHQSARVTPATPAGVSDEVWPPSGLLS